MIMLSPDDQILYCQDQIQRYLLRIISRASEYSDHRHKFEFFLCFLVYYFAICKFQKCINYLRQEIFKLNKICFQIDLFKLLIYYTRDNIYYTDSSNFNQLQNIPPSREDSNLWSRDLEGTALYRKPRVPSTIVQKISEILKKIIIAIVVAIIETIMA